MSFFTYCRQKHGMVVNGVIHVGGHYGEELEEYDACGIKDVVVFEPDSDNFKVLQEHSKKYSNVRCINEGLGPFSCKMELNKETANSGQSNSVLKPLLHITQYPHIVFNSKVEIQIHPLDRYNMGENFNLMVVDVQGFELEVFRGAKKTLAHVNYIITEVNRAELYEGCCRVDELDDFLSKFGFFRMETHWEGDTWGNAFYGRNRNNFIVLGSTMGGVICQ